uniref:Uncharacterized protein n=1 Tax=Chaetoceros debilis TaxID=122233 RepID=A0A7S3V7P9_9STRA
MEEAIRGKQRLEVRMGKTCDVNRSSNKKRSARTKCVSFVVLVILLIDPASTTNIVANILPTCNASTASSPLPTSSSTTSIGISGYRETFDNGDKQQILTHDNASTFSFQRFQSSKSIRKAILPSSPPSFKSFQGKDGRKGCVSSTKLGGDWVLAQSKQVAVDATTEEVLKAYLTGELQERWNTKEVLECTITCKNTDTPIEGNPMNYRDVRNGMSTTVGRNSIAGTRGGNRKITRHNPMAATLMNLKSKYYQQDLVLKSQRVITSHTGIMKYSQTISIDQVGHDNYSVMIRLDDSDNIHKNGNGATSTKKKPFDALSVHVALEQDGDNVNIYANGVMKVNRKVVPNLIIFDASGIAGSMSGKATLWLAPYFEKRKRTMKAKVNSSGMDVGMGSMYE